MASEIGDHFMMVLWSVRGNLASQNMWGLCESTSMFCDKLADACRSRFPYFLPARLTQINNLHLVEDLVLRQRTVHGSTQGRFK